jgi:hypothetical protein
MDLYVMGLRSPNRSFEIKEKTTKKKSQKSRNYMLDEDVREVYRGKNYADLTPNRKLDNTMLGIYEFRRAFYILYEYNGGGPRRVQGRRLGKYQGTCCKVLRKMLEGMQHS